MESLKDKWTIILVALIAAGIVWFAWSAMAHAADKGALGGDCCADLEERVAELEATTAKKGNRKVSLTISGQVNAAISWVDIGSYSKAQVTGSNGNDRSFVAMTGTGRINKDLSAGYHIEIDLSNQGLLGAPVSGTNELGVRESYWFLKSEAMGKVSVGKNALATKGFDEWSTNSAWVAGKPLGLGSLSDLYLSGIDIPLNGDEMNGYRNVVRYDSPTIAGFTLSATWGDSLDIHDKNGNGNAFDVAVRYAAEMKDWLFKGAAGYQRSTDLKVDLLGLANITIPTGDVDKFLVTGSVMNVPTGLFLNTEYAHSDYTDANFKLQGIDVTGGAHEKWNELGPSEIFGSWGRFTIDAGKSTDIDYYGLGATQALDAAAMTLYVGWRHYQTNDLIGSNVDTVTGGAVMKF